MRLALLDELSQSQRILLVGAGGGYDIFCGLPLYHWLRNRGRTPYLASLSFRGDRLERVNSVGSQPEECLAGFLRADLGEEVPVYRFGAGGTQQILAHYRQLVQDLDLDAMVLVDGGTDSLLRGDEPGLGSPGEDVASLAAAHQLDLPVRLLASLGFGLDAHHHVCHAYVLEAAADLTASGDFLGAFSLLAGMPELEFLSRAVEFAARQPGSRPSIIAGSVVAAARGRFGDVHVSSRTSGSSLLLNPLMAMFWGFRVDGLARRCLYLDAIKQTRSRGEITQALHRFRATISPRPWIDLPF
ncbi:MAG: DUF1152 domain-containing protein [Vulcanimicrobiota bacterium]